MQGVVVPGCLVASSLIFLWYKIRLSIFPNSTHFLCHLLNFFLPFYSKKGGKIELICRVSKVFKKGKINLRVE